MAGVILMFTQCGKESEPEPETAQETWQLTYDDYHTLLSPSEEEYKNRTHNVTIIRKGDELSIKGLFSEYPETYTEFTIKGDWVYLITPQILGIDNGNPVYIHWGYLFDDYSGGNTFSNRMISFNPGSDIQAAFRIREGGSKMTGTNNSNGDKGVFWYNNDEKGTLGFNSCWHRDDNTYTGTGFPDLGNMTNITLQKVSGAKQ